MKGIPLAYNKDMQEDKEAIFDAIDNTKICLELFSSMLETATFKTQRMRDASAYGFINATDCADYLVKKGMPFRSAYKIIGRLVAYCIENGKSLDTLSLDEYKQFSDVFDSDVYEAIDLNNCVNGRKCYGGPAPESVKRQIENMRSFIKKA